MGLLSKFRQVHPSDRHLLAEAALVVPIIRLALTVLPFRTMHRVIGAATRWLRRQPSAAPRDPERITWAVSTIARRVPAATCLTQALGGTLLLVRRGHSPVLRVGVAKNDDGTLRAHAWLECDGETILGAPVPGAFALFPPVAFS